MLDACRGDIKTHRTSDFEKCVLLLLQVTMSTKNHKAHDALALHVVISR